MDQESERKTLLINWQVRALVAIPFQDFQVIFVKQNWTAERKKNRPFWQHLSQQI
jgi:hypothetical protein